MGSTVKMQGFQSYDIDIGDEVIGWIWSKNTPADSIVKNTLSNPNFVVTRFELPSYIPTKPVLFPDLPSPLPIDISLIVTDKLGEKSNPDGLTINVKCTDGDQKSGEYFRNLLKGSVLFNNKFSSLYPQAADNFRYFLSGSGDTEGRPIGISGKGIPQPLPVEWLKSTSEFEKGLDKLSNNIKKDIRENLKVMEKGETRVLPSKTYSHLINTQGDFPTDFIVAIYSNA